MLKTGNNKDTPPKKTNNNNRAAGIVTISHKHITQVTDLR